MFDGAAVSTAVDVADATMAETPTASATENNSESTSSESNNENSLAEQLGNYVVPNGPANEIVFVDTSVEDYETILSGIDPNIQVVLLDSQQDGIEQIADYLSNQNSIDAIHLISHGDAGTLQLGTGTLNLVSMQGEYADELSTIGQALTQEADLLIYGCNFGEGDSGKEAATLLSKLTGADVAASDDLTGHESLGGDWDLEVESGSIETQVAIGDAGQQDWKSLLDITTGLAAHYDFEEGSGTTLTDQTTNNNDGTLYNSPTWSTGQVGNGALDFAGDFDRVEVPDNSVTRFWHR